MDRSGYRTRKLALADEGQGDDLDRMTPGERVEMVWPLTVQAWTFMLGSYVESRLRRDVVRTVRGPR